MNYNKRANHGVFKVCGWIGLLGCIAAIVTDIVGIIVVETHNPISDTISSLAITRHAWIQDSGIVMFAFGMIAYAIALSRYPISQTRWKLGTVSLFLLGIDIVLIAIHNKYAGREGVGASIHLQCVVVMGILFALATALLASGFKKIGRNWYRYTILTTGFWVVLAPIFFIMPTAVDGGYERLVAMIMVSWIAAVSLFLSSFNQENYPQSDKY